jgi:hypothetical protein
MNTAATRVPLFRLAGFLLDDGGHRHELLRRLDRQIWHAAVPDFLHHPRLRLLHALDHLLARHAARELVGFRQQRSFARDLCGCFPERTSFLQQPRHDHARMWRPSASVN